MELLDNWKMQCFEWGERPPLELAAADLDDRFWISTQVPGDVHSTLVERGVISDPYFGHNDVKCRWIESKEWWFRRKFDFTIQDGETYVLTFDGLDTFATVYLNGLELGRADNALMGHSFGE